MLCQFVFILIIGCLQIRKVNSQTSLSVRNFPTPTVPSWSGNVYPTFGERRRCGLDRAPTGMIYDGLVSVDTYPWLGRLFYPINNRKITTTVVLITKELVIGSAFDIDKYPKTDFRAKARVVLGSNCAGPQFSILDYIFHPEYRNNTYSALAIIQLDLQNETIQTHPICVPAKEVLEAEFYAFTMPQSCADTNLRVYKMEYVDPVECQAFYRRSGLDQADMWPTHTACARAARGRPCVWRGGAALVLRERGRWRLAGLGVYGPGCRTPARFLDYGMYRPWVRRNILRIGRAAVTRIAENQIILRRTKAQIQRFGPCDPEERQYEVFADETDIFATYEFYYNLTLFTTVEYNCIILQVDNLLRDVDYPTPKIRLKRWCSAADRPACEASKWEWVKMDFAVHIFFLGPVHFKVNAYGRPSRTVDRKTYTKYMNGYKNYPKIDWVHAPVFTPLNKDNRYKYTHHIRPG